MILNKLSRSLEGIELFRVLGTLGAIVEIDNYRSPDYIKSPDQWNIYKDYLGKGRSNYYTAIRCISGSSIQIEIEPKIQFSGLEFEILGMDGIESIDVEITYYQDDNIIRVKNHQFSDRQVQNFNYRFPINSSIHQLCDFATIQINFKYNRNYLKSLVFNIKNWLLSRMTHRKFVMKDVPRVTMPVPTHLSEEQTPIILISIDSLRYDSIHNLQPLVTELGTTINIPFEPRTKGHWTPPSHASMFTGVHPGVHNYTGIGHFANHPIHPELVTVSELLNSVGYKCSSIVSHTRILPESGFGGGFYRFDLQNMTNWLNRQNDSRTVVNRAINQIEEDLMSDRDSLNLFYFLHIFDAHYPYIPIHPTATIGNFDILDYNPTKNMSKNGVSAKKLYEISVKQVGHQIRKLIINLKMLNIFNQSLIIITGDHGELFGEYESFGHSTLYDPNIRPLMMVKPPDNAEWRVPDECSTLDFLPTIARVVGEDIPNQCQGIAWQDVPEKKACRITEGIYSDRYQVKVEIDGISGIFTYDSNDTGRPEKISLEAGPQREEYYKLNDTRNGNFTQINDTISENLKKNLLYEARQFIETNEINSDSEKRVVTVLEETREQLNFLGYK